MREAQRVQAEQAQRARRDHLNALRNAEVRDQNADQGDESAASFELEVRCVCADCFECVSPNSAAQCHSVAFASSARPLLDWGDKIALPPSALQVPCSAWIHLRPHRSTNANHANTHTHTQRTQTLIDNGVRMPVCFRVTCARTGQRGHCGVAEFNAPDGLCYLPRWFVGRRCSVWFLGADSISSQVIERVGRR